LKTTVCDAPKATSKGDYKIWQVIAASAVGTMIDFYIFGSLAVTICHSFILKATILSR
jgi:hypothetical protein